MRRTSYEAGWNRLAKFVREQAIREQARENARNEAERAIVGAELAKWSA